MLTQDLSKILLDSSTIQLVAIKLEIPLFKMKMEIGITSINEAT